MANIFGAIAKINEYQTSQTRRTRRKGQTGRRERTAEGGYLGGEMGGERVKKEGHGEVAFLGDYGRVLLFFCGAGAEVEVEDDGSVGYEAEELGK